MQNPVVNASLSGPAFCPSLHLQIKLGSSSKFEQR